MPTSTSVLCCPVCRSTLTVAAAAKCPEGHTFPIDQGVIDFVKHPPVDALHRAYDTCSEMAGAQKRTAGYLIPWIQSGGQLTDIRVLEDGCGYGETVKQLVVAGVDAYGIDPGRRNKHWDSLDIRGRLFIADGTELPFADASFDVVTSSGVLEHVGEGFSADKTVQHPAQETYIHEAIRVLVPGGRALIAHPNGAFPIDFWHARRPIKLGLRFHRPYEGWMPNAISIRSWVASSPEPARVRFLPPENYLAFERVRTHWYGRAFSGAMRGLFATIDSAPRLAPTPLNPWLISEITRL